MLGKLLGAWQASREAAALQRRAIADDLWKRTLVRYPFLQQREPEAALELRRLTSLFLDRKEFSAAGGLKLTNAMVVAIAAQAALPVLRLGLERYDSFVGIVVHPDAVRVHRETMDEAGVVHFGEQVLAGEAMHGGPMMLSWRDVRAAGSGPKAGSGYAVVIHEFAHVLDLADGLSDGVPLLPAHITRQAWCNTLARECDALIARLDAGEQDTALDPYGTQGPDEFFAVASEVFFVNPKALGAEHPQLYAMLSRFYRQDPLRDP